MKKLLLALVFALLFVGVLTADIWYPANQRTIAWDAVTNMTDEDGNIIPIPSGDIVTYEVWIKDFYSGVTESVGTTSDTQLIITLPSEGRYYPGVCTLRLPQGETDTVSSTISWGDDPLVTQSGERIGIYYYFFPEGPVGLR